MLIALIANEGDDAFLVIFRKGMLLGRFSEGWGTCPLADPSFGGQDGRWVRFVRSRIGADGCTPLPSQSMLKGAVTVRGAFLCSMPKPYGFLVGSLTSSSRPMSSKCLGSERMPSPLADERGSVEVFDDFDAVKPGGEPGSSVVFIALQKATAMEAFVNDLCR